MARNPFAELGLSGVAYAKWSRVVRVVSGGAKLP